MKKKSSYPDLYECTIAIIGLGYVGLPIAVEFSKEKNCFLTGKKLNRKVIGFDIDEKRIDELKNGFDRTNEVSLNQLRKNSNLDLTNDFEKISFADVFIITVPTPIDDYKKPDLTALVSATKTVAKALKIRNQRNLIEKIDIIPIVIYESTVFPGATDEICIPLIEKEANLLCGTEKNINQFDFACGYSPERINPGDKEHKIKDITKVTSGSSFKAADWIDKFYGSIIEAGTFKAKSIKIAEAAKIIENTQRDINVALVNELAIIFKLLKIDTLDVLEAASTKWNFLPFKPGLVGGHCICVDPYYLTYKSESLGYCPEVVLSGRKINDGMAKWISDQLILELCNKKKSIKNVNVLVLGFTFKENCPDIRNTKIDEIVRNFQKFNINFDIVDPWVDEEMAFKEFNLKVNNNFINGKKYSAVMSLVAHKQFLEMDIKQWRVLMKRNCILFDLKGFMPRELKPIRI